MVEKVELTDGFVLLRPYQISDAERMYKAARESMTELSVWMEWCHPDYSIEESREWVGKQNEAWEKGTAYNFSMVDLRDGSYMGGCGIGDIVKGKVANLGYWVRTSRTKRGAATAATKLLARFGFEELKLIRIEIQVASPNLASQRVAEKSGARREGILRNRMGVRAKVYDEVMFSLIPADIL